VVGAVEVDLVADVVFAVPVGAVLVAGGVEGGKEVEHVRLVGVLDAQVVDYEGKAEWARAVAEEGSGFGLMDVGVLGKVGDEVLAREKAGLWEAPERLADLEDDRVVIGGSEVWLDLQAIYDSLR
jgi:hypothetical protein